MTEERVVKDHQVESIRLCLHYVGFQRFEPAGVSEPCATCESESRPTRAVDTNTDAIRAASRVATRLHRTQGQRSEPTEERGAVLVVTFVCFTKK